MTRPAPPGEDSSVIPLPPAAVLFDLDGTLIDSLDDIAHALGAALREGGHPVPDRASIGRMVGDGARVLVQRALSGTGSPSAALGPNGADPAVVSAVLASFQKAYARDPAPATRVLPGALELLDRLGELRIPRIVCTNKPRAVSELVLARVLPGRTDGLVAGGDTPRLKPDRAMIDRALALATAPAHLAVMVGDGPQDILSARAAGVFAIGVRGGFVGEGPLLAAAPDLLVERLDDLVEVLGLR
jgi:phosphoglycolate phosphatase